MNNSLPRVIATIVLVSFVLNAASAAPYSITTTAPQAGGCPQPNHFNLPGSAPLNAGGALLCRLWRLR